MPLMRIRSVEIVFEDEMSTCTDTGLLDRSLELIASDSNDDSTKCVDDIEILQVEKDDNDSVTLNADGDLSDDNSSLAKDDAAIDIPKVEITHSTDSIKVQSETIFANDDVSSSLNASEVGDSGRFTEEASSSHFEPLPISYDDALLSHSFDIINVDTHSTVLSTHEIGDAYVFDDIKSRLYEYIDSSSDSSDSTAVCDGENYHKPNLASISDLLTDLDEAQMVCDGSDLQYDSFVDMGKF